MQDAVEQVWDIEDLVSAGKVNKRCPYMASRAALAGKRGTWIT